MWAAMFTGLNPILAWSHTRHSCFLGEMQRANISSVVFTADWLTAVFNSQLQLCPFLETSDKWTIKLVGFFCSVIPFQNDLRIYSGPFPISASETTQLSPGCFSFSLLTCKTVLQRPTSPLRSLWPPLAICHFVLDSLHAIFQLWKKKILF